MKFWAFPYTTLCCTKWDYAKNISRKHQGYSKIVNLNINTANNNCLSEILTCLNNNITSLTQESFSNNFEPHSWVAVYYFINRILETSDPTLRFPLNFME